MNTRVRRVLGVAAGIIAGIVIAGVLIILTQPPFDHSVDPRSAEGIKRALSAAVMAFVAGVAIDFLPRRLSRAALRTSAGLVGTLGLLGLALNPEYMAFLYGLVIAPAVALGSALAQRRRGPHLASDLPVNADRSSVRLSDEV